MKCDGSFVGIGGIVFATTFFHDISEFDARHVTSYFINILSRKTRTEFKDSFFLTLQIGDIV